MADEELHEKTTDDQPVAPAEVIVDEAPGPDASESIDQDVLAQAEEASKTAQPDEVAQAVEYAENDEIALDQIENVLNANIPEKDMSPQMRRMIRRQQENTKRVEESIKGTKANPGWFVPLFCALMIIGLIWAVVYYLTSSYPIPAIHQWNLLVAFGFIMAGFIMTMWWR